jgi:short subunit dehydrogenase-like uncharacterized protein
VVLGATGYTGRLTAQALVDSGAAPVLAARSPDRLDELAHELGLETQVADVSDPATVRSLVERGDVLISTVGPFARWGETAVEAAIATGATYIDTTGEPAFIRRVFEHYGPAAARAGTALLTALGFDFVPGNLAAELVLRAAGPQATDLTVGYFSQGSSHGVSGGTKASAAGAALSPSFALRQGHLRTERTGARVRRITLDDGTVLQGISVGGSEHFAVRSLHPQLYDIDVLLERPGVGGVLTPALTALLVVANKIPGVGARLHSMLGSEGSTGGPDAEARSGSRSLIVADARSTSGELLHRVVMQGPNGYDFTARILAWASTEAARVGIAQTGAVGPVAAFGLEPLRLAAENAGLRQVSTSRITRASR